jgi:hypothetical protein
LMRQNGSQFSVLGALARTGRAMPVA